MLSRIAESMFWIGRYVERAEDTARLLQTHLRLLVEDTSAAAEVDACRYLLALMSVDHIENPTHADLLRVLDRPDVPLHNNAAESDIREYVQRRKISGGTRSDDGRRCRDTFASLKKTCRKLGVRFWDYLQDRVRALGRIPRLAELIQHRSLAA